MSVASDTTNDEKIEESREGEALSGWGSGGIPQNPFWAGGWEQSTLGRRANRLRSVYFQGNSIHAR